MAKTIVALFALLITFAVHADTAEAGCESSESYSSSTWQSCNSDTSHAGIYSYGCYGRCGPACNWGWLGNVYTGSCQTHDWCVRNGLAQGRTTWSAHANCVGTLGNAARSWFSNSWHAWRGKIRDKATGFISDWL